METTNGNRPAQSPDDETPGSGAQKINRVVVRFAGDSGDGMQLTGDRFTSEAAAFGNDLATLPNFPAEIRAPAGTRSRPARRGSAHPVTLELPLVVCDIQRGGPSTGLPTKTEQADLLQALYGRNGESPVPVVAPRSPGDCFDAAIEAVRIALTYRTPVLLLSDGAVANGSEPWLIPDVAELPDLRVRFATEPNAPDGSGEFWPYVRDPETLAREWAVPGTPGLEHRVGGLEKAEGAGHISYDPDNHDQMVRLRQAKVDGVTVPDLEVDDPSGEARVLVIGWGSSYGPIGAACRRVRSAGMPIAQAHVRHLNPMPGNLGEVLGRYDRVVVPEMNLGQLAMLLRARYLVDAVSHTKVAGLPFQAEELQDVLTDVVQGVLV